MDFEEDDQDMEEYRAAEEEGEASQDSGSSSDSEEDDSSEGGGGDDDQDDDDGTSSGASPADPSAKAPALHVSAPSPSGPADRPPRSPGSGAYTRLVLQRFTTATAPRVFGKPPAVENLLAIAHGSPVHALAVPPCGSHLFSGGGDGFIRRIAIHESITGSSAENLTMRQGGHAPAERSDEPKPFLEGYWENEDGHDVAVSTDSRLRWGPKSVGGAVRVSPVYSLAVQNEELWGLSGTESGNINLFTIRHDEGQIRHVFKSSFAETGSANSTQGHRDGSAVSCLTLNYAQNGFLSGGWDGSIIDWDLNTGQTTNRYVAHSSQLSTVAYRLSALGSLYTSKSDADVDSLEDEPMAPPDDVPHDPAPDAEPTPIPAKPNGHSVEPASEADAPGSADGSPAPDSFDALFDGDGGDEDALGSDAAGSIDESLVPSSTAPVAGATAPLNPPAVAKPLLPPVTAPPVPPVTDASLPLMSSDVFLTSAIDGQVFLWDRRISGTAKGAVRRLPLMPGASPWCASAAWSVDGQSVFAGRRNHCVDIYDLRYIKEGQLQRSLRLPASSGPVSCVGAWPDGKNVICASFDNVRLWNLEAEANGAKLPFRIVPGNSSGVVSQMYVTPSQRYFITASGDRGWENISTESVVIHEIRNID